MATKAVKAAKSTKKQVQPKVVQNVSQAQSVYSNVVMVNTSPLDIRLLFGVFAVSGPNEVNETYSHAMYLTPTTAKRLAGILNLHLKTYETQFGSIPDLRSDGEQP